MGHDTKTYGTGPANFFIENPHNGTVHEYSIVATLWTMSSIIKLELWLPSQANDHFVSYR